MEVDTNDAVRVLVQFKSEAGEPTGAPFDLPLNITVDKLNLLCCAFLQKEEVVPYSFFVDDEEIVTSLHKALSGKDLDHEKVLDIIYQPQAIFRVRAVTRCSSSLPGHAEAVVSASFSPEGRFLASGSGDTTVRFWDVDTELPLHVGRGHQNWVLCIAWSPNGKKLASGDKSGKVILWDAETGNAIGKPLNAHDKWITCIVWEPLLTNAECRRFATSSKDTRIKIWDAVLRQVLLTLTGHTGGISSLRWGGTGLIYSGSQDKTVKVWRASDGVMCRTLEGHAHWVNTLALNTDYVLRTGPFDPAKAELVYRELKGSASEIAERAKKRYDDMITALGGGGERLVSGSDDFTLILWEPENSKKMIGRLTGHVQLVNDIKFSPDGRLMASASFDKSIKIWDGRTGKFLSTLRGHVQAVHQIAWSADSRLLVSGSADSTLKVWAAYQIAKTNFNKEGGRGLLYDLPGHADSVYAVDWAPDGQRVVSGGKDKVLKIWRR